MHPYHHVKTEDGRESLTIFMPSGAPVVATGDHPHFVQLLEGAQSDAPADDLRSLADLSNAVAQHFDTLSERVAVANGRVYFDGDEVDSTVTRQIVRCLDDPSVGDWKPLVLFMENVAANPNPHSREQLFDWLRDRDFTITTNGCFIAYKGVTSIGEGDDMVYVSCSSGHGIVNGEYHEGQLPNFVGATVEMPRGDVQHDPSVGCHTGLHVGTYEYAQGYNRAALLTVLVNPRDVVSVPTDCNAEKMRVCRYVVSDDDPTPPQESAAIADVTEPERELIEHEGDTYVVTEERPVKYGELYWNTVYEAPVVASFDHGSESKLLRKAHTERISDGIPEGAYVETGEVRHAVEGEFYLWEGVVCQAIVDHVGACAESTILVPLS